jgi:hypothetical protein
VFNVFFLLFGKLPKPMILTDRHRHLHSCNHVSQRTPAASPSNVIRMSAPNASDFYTPRISFGQANQHQNTKDAVGQTQTDDQRCHPGALQPSGLLPGAAWSRKPILKACSLSEVPVGVRFFQQRPFGTCPERGREAAAGPALGGIASPSRGRGIVPGAESLLLIKGENTPLASRTALQRARTRALPSSIPTAQRPSDNVYLTTNVV